MENELIEKCNRCEKKISRDEYIDNDGLCIKCYNEDVANEENENNDEDVENNNHPVSIMLKIIAILTIIGGIYLGAETEEFIFFVYSVVVSAFVFGFASIIQLLKDILEELKK